MFVIKCGAAFGECLTILEVNASGITRSGTYNSYAFILLVFDVLDAEVIKLILIFYDNEMHNTKVSVVCVFKKVSAKFYNQL